MGEVGKVFGVKFYRTIVWKLIFLGQCMEGTDSGPGVKSSLESIEYTPHIGFDPLKQITICLSESHCLRGLSVFSARIPQKH